VESIRRFPSQKVFAEKFEAANFVEVDYTNLVGGVAAIQSGYKFIQ
jgi:demethylmenaquinone methyltransferase/2-methoxy-6-polyprenyl-1,4-benzoquinol methylase